jgi:prepilin-type N-terminal cleavage/methylation domain-containing protein
VTPRRGSRAGERGFTLVEVLVSMALLAIIGTVMGAVSSVGMRAILVPGASRDRLAAASDAIGVQQLLSTDVHRATCISIPSATSPGLFGSCEHETSPFQGECSVSELCLEWPDLTAAGQCDVAIYSLGAQQVSRAEWLGGTEAATISYPVVVTPSARSGAWPMELEVTVTSPNARLANPPSVTLDLQPLATVAWPTDPVSDASSGPC